MFGGCDISTNHPGRAGKGRKGFILVPVKYSI